MIFKSFEKQNYLNLETFRKNGQGVKTPVWFAREGEALYVWTQRGTGKAKRVRNNGNVNIAPATVSGELLGEWVPAHATADESPEAVKHVKALMSKKYGLMFYFLGFIARMRGGSAYTAIQIQSQQPLSS